MSFSVNKVVLVGNLGQTPELIVTSTGTQVCNLSIATTERVKRNGKWENETEWHRVVCFGKTAENAVKYLKKGSKVYIEGRNQTQKWTDKEGQVRYTTKVIANTIGYL